MSGQALAAQRQRQRTVKVNGRDDHAGYWDHADTPALITGDDGATHEPQPTADGVGVQAGLPAQGG